LFPSPAAHRWYGSGRNGSAGSVVSLCRLEDGSVTWSVTWSMMRPRMRATPGPAADSRFCVSQIGLPARSPGRVSGSCFWALSPARVQRGESPCAAPP